MSELLITTSRWPPTVIETSFETIITAPKFWRKFEGERLNKLTNWLEYIGAGPVHVATASNESTTNEHRGEHHDNRMDSVGNFNRRVDLVNHRDFSDRVEGAGVATITTPVTLNCGAIMGSSGTGKSYTLKRRIEADPKYAILAATTGIAAVNLGEGVTTIHSLLGFYDLASALQAFRKGSITKKFIKLAKLGFKNVVIDEMSMLPAELLQIIHDAAWAAAERIAGGNVYREIVDDNGDARRELVTEPCGVILTGDFLQLPPVSGKFAFTADCWKEYSGEGRIERLTKIWRQDNPQFLTALKWLRQGSGAVAAIELKKAGVAFSPNIDNDFDGVTLFATNKSVDKFNRERLEKLPGDSVVLVSAKLGRKSAEWESISDELVIKKDALVMILVNDHDSGFVNGDLAYVMSTPKEIAENSVVTVKLRRNDQIKIINYVMRENLSYDENDSLFDQFKRDHSELQHRLDTFDLSDKQTYAMYKEYMAGAEIGEPFKPYWEPVKGATVVGVVEYMPLRIAYASTTHKAQGLTLESVQIDANNKWAGNPGMMYVAVSRCKTPEGIRIAVSDMSRFARRVNTAKEVREWI